MTTGVDRLNRSVKIGDKVRLLAIRPSILKNLSGEEYVDVSSMLGQVLEVFDIYDDGLIWVSLVWDRGNGSSELHTIAVDSDAVELVTTATET